MFETRFDYGSRATNEVNPISNDIEEEYKIKLPELLS